MSDHRIVKGDGKISKCLPNAQFEVEMYDTKRLVRAGLSGKMRYNKIRISLGDSVTVEQDCSNMSIGRIVFRAKK